MFIGVIERRGEKTAKGGSGQKQKLVLVDEAPKKDKSSGCC